MSAEAATDAAMSLIIDREVRGAARRGTAMEIYDILDKCIIKAMQTYLEELDRFELLDSKVRFLDENNFLKERELTHAVMGYVRGLTHAFGMFDKDLKFFLESLGKRKVIAIYRGLSLDPEKGGEEHLFTVYSDRIECKVQ